jgi:hypothetical protein
MDSATFEVKSYPDMWKSLGMNVERFEKMRCVLGDVFQATFLSQENRPKRMDYFNWIVSEIHGGRIREILDAKKEGRPVVGTFCVYVPEGEGLRENRLDRIRTNSHCSEFWDETFMQ